MNETAPAKMGWGHLAARWARRGTPCRKVSPRHPEERHPIFDQLEKFLKNKTGVAGLIIIVFFTLAAILAPLLTRTTRTKTRSTTSSSRPPGRKAAR